MPAEGNIRAGRYLGLNDEGGMRIGTSDGVLVIHELQPAGGKSMPARAFLNGHPSPLGTWLAPPRHDTPNLITLEYDGGPFCGWQRQKTGLSVQQVLEEAAASLTGQQIMVQGAGRTDAGVHATGQVAHLDVPDKFDATRVMEALNSTDQPHPVTILEAREVDLETHAGLPPSDGAISIVSAPPSATRPISGVWHHRAPEC